MSAKLCVSILCSLVFIVDACDSNGGTSQNSTPTNTSPAVASSTNPAGTVSVAKPEAPANNKGAETRALDACGLIEKSEIESVQGAKLQGTAPNKRQANALAISQCYFTVTSADGSKNLSVHLEVTQNDEKNTNQNAVGDLWKERFLGAQGTKKMEKPKPVSGVGDGAYWLGNNKAGALYVLKNDKLVRISIGGPDNEEMKVQKTKALAEKVLKRLS